MKITDIRAYVMNVPAADAETPRRNWIFVEVETDAGVTGIGEATTEHHEMAVAAQVETALKPRLLGMDPTDVEQVWQLGYRDFWWKRGVVHTSAVSGIDMALWDIVGKATGQPVFKLLGGKVRSRVRCYARADLGLDSLEAHAAQALEEGFDAFKHGHGPAVTPFDMDAQVDVAVEEMTRLREALGPGRGADDRLRRRVLASGGASSHAGTAAAESVLRGRADRAEHGGAVRKIEAGFSGGSGCRG